MDVQSSFTLEHLYIRDWNFGMDTLIEMEMDIISLGGDTYDFKNFVATCEVELWSGIEPYIQVLKASMLALSCLEGQL